MTIRKNDPNSPFWRAAEEAARRVDKFPPWKLGKIEHDERRPPPPVSLVDALQDRVHRDPGHGRAAKTVRHRKAWSMLAEAEREEAKGATLDERESEQVMRDVESVCSPEEARRRIRLARQRLGEMMIAEPEEHDQGETNMDAFRAGFHLPDRL